MIEVKQDELARFCADFNVSEPAIQVTPGRNTENPSRLGDYGLGVIRLFVETHEVTGQRLRFTVSTLNRTLLHELCHHIQWCEDRLVHDKPGSYWGELIEVEARAFENEQASKYHLIRVKKPQMRTRFSSLSDAQSRVRARQ